MTITNVLLHIKEHKIYVLKKEESDKKAITLNGEDYFDYDSNNDLNYLKKSIFDELSIINNEYTITYISETSDINLIKELTFIFDDKLKEEIEEAKSEETEGKEIGIDLGTTKSVISYMKEGKPQILKISKVGNGIIPSAIYFESPESIFYGDIAITKDNSNKSLNSILKEFKRDMGKSNHKYEIYYGSSKDKPILITPEEASCKFLIYLKDEATKKIGFISKAVITVPANFDQSQTEATLNAANNAGFKQVEIRKEPTAAAIAYGFEEEEDKKILIYDFGGGTFDVSVIECKHDDTGKIEFNVLKTGGNQNLGGKDFTQKIIDWVVERILNDFELDMSNFENSKLKENKFIYNKRELLKACERAKIYLSSFDDALINIPGFNYTDEKLSPLEIKITKKDFERLIQKDVKETIDILKYTIDECKLDKNQIDIIALVGGTSLIPLIQEEVSTYFGKPVTTKKNAATVVAEGAAIYADRLFNKNSIHKIDIIENAVYDFGIRVDNHQFDCLIPGGTILPVTETKMYDLMIDNQQSLEIELYRRKKTSAKKTFDDGIEYINTVIISNLPPVNKSDVKVAVKFELSKNDVLTVYVNLKDIKTNTIIESKNIKIKKTSGS